MYAFSAVISLALAIAATAAPAKRAVSCQPSSSVLANVTKFTMTAFTADSNGVLNGSWPLTIGPATKSGGLDVLASVDSFPGAAPSDFTMHSSAIATLASDGVTTVEWDNNITGDPSFLSFSPASKPAANAEIYCASVSTSAHGNPNIPWVILLQLNNDSTRFSLCKTLNGLNAVIYGNPQLASKSSGIVTSSCISNVGIGIKEI